MNKRSRSAPSGKYDTQRRESHPPGEPTLWRRGDSLTLDLLANPGLSLTHNNVVFYFQKKKKRRRESPRNHVMTRDAPGESMDVDRPSALWHASTSG